jgi:hypothetical protein
MRAPNDRPSAAEVAGDIASVFGFGQRGIPAIERSLLSLDHMLRDIEQFPKIAEIKKDFAGLHEHAELLHEKYKEIPALAYPLRAVMSLDPEKIMGPAPQFDWVKYSCAIVARGLILSSPNKQLGQRLRDLASRLYWYVTGIDLVDKDYPLERACRAVTALHAEIEKLRASTSRTPN